MGRADWQAGWQFGRLAGHGKEVLCGEFDII